MTYIIYKNGEEINRILADEDFCEKHYHSDGYSYEVALESDSDTMDAVQDAKLDELSNACNIAITAGCDVVLSSAFGHITLTAEDQINLSMAVQSVEQGAEGYPYHLDGQLCTIFPAEDIRVMGNLAMAHKLYHTTYYNHLAAWVRRCETVADVDAVTYGADLPEDLAENMAAILAGIGGKS